MIAVPDFDEHYDYYCVRRHSLSACKVYPLIRIYLYTYKRNNI